MDLQTYRYIVKNGDFLDKKIALNEIQRSGYLFKDLFHDSSFRFESDRHRYTFKNEEISGCTTFIKRFIEEFKSDYWSRIKARQRGISQQEILDEWEYKRDSRGAFGTSFHSIIEHIIQYGTVPINLIDNEEMLYRVARWKELYDSRISKLELVSIELRIFSYLLGIAGTIDVLFKHQNYYIIGDWKTNEKITIDKDKHYNMLLPPFNKEKENDLNKYSLQLSLYALILEEWGIETKNNFICHIPPEGPGVIHFCKDYKPILREYFRNLLKKNDDFLCPI